MGERRLYRVTEVVTYLVEAEDDAHAEHRLLTEEGIREATFHAVESREIEPEN